MDKKTLFSNWIKFKKAEETAKLKRHAVEAEIEKLYSLKKKEASKTFKEEDLGFSINVKKNESVKLDQELYTKARSFIPEELRPENIIYKLDMNGYKYLKEHEKDIYKEVSKCVTIIPGKTGITVKKIKGGKK